MPKIDLSIIIISYNTRQILTDCVESVIKNTKGIRYEIILVENGSTDGSLEQIKKLKKKYSQVNLVNTQKNLGFGAGNNVGIQQAKGEYLLLLNSDTIITDNAIANSLNKARILKRLGSYSCKLLNADGTLQPSGGHFPTLGNLLAWQLFVDDLPLIGPLIPSFHPQLSQYDQNQKLDWVTGAFVILPKRVFDEVGGFDQNIFMYTEEMELFYRLAQKGYRSYYDPTYSIIHLGGASGGSFLALTSEVRYMLYFWQKHKPRWQLPIAKIVFFVGSLLRLIIFGIIKGDEKARRAYTYALGYCF